jgi:hypothetical protein
VIDVHLYRGGDDPLGIEIASRLTDSRYLGYSKVTRNNLGGALRLTDPQETWIAPSARPGFRGDVVLLTGPDTVSAGETFTMALLGREPHVTRYWLEHARRLFRRSQPQTAQPGGGFDYRPKSI